MIFFHILDFFELLKSLDDESELMYGFLWHPKKVDKDKQKVGKRMSKQTIKTSEGIDAKFIMKT